MEAFRDPLAHLALLDPELARQVTEKLADASCFPDQRQLQRLVDEVMRAVALSIPLAGAVASGGAELLAHGPPEGLDRYWSEVRAASSHGPELGRLVAEFLVPVIRYAPPGFGDRLNATLAVMRQKGIYTLKRPMEAVATLLGQGQQPSASAFLKLLEAAFAGELTYNQSLHLTHILPRAVLAFAPPRRAAQIEQLRRVVEADFRLADDFIEGLDDGLKILDPPALATFVDQALARWRRHPDFGRRMLALKTRVGREACRALQRAAALAEIRPVLGRYLSARTGCRLAIRPLTELSGSRGTDLPSGPAVCSDGLGIYLPEEIDREATYAQNVAVFKLLVRIEAGFYEHATFDFDLERLAGPSATQPAEGDALSDLERFLSGFASAELAEDLLTVAEHGRLRRLWEQRSPGLWRRSRTLLQAELARVRSPGELSVVDWLYGRLVFASDPHPRQPIAPALMELVEDSDFLLASGAPVEASGAWVVAAYPLVAASFGHGVEAPRLVTPFGWRVRAGFFGDAHRDLFKTADRLQPALRQQGARVYRSALVRRLIENNGRLDADDLAALVHRQDCRLPDTKPVELSAEQLNRLIRSDPTLAPRAAETPGPATWYPEWDHQAGGYLADHVRVVDRQIGDISGDFYHRTLIRFHGLVDRVRRAFELLRPEAVAILRPWIEGDEFDYRALIDYAVDHRAGTTPNDRLYIKRVKSMRDVAVLLLVDLSRSTGNRVAGGRQTVVEVEKEAIVLFCEALKVVGDRFALAGFSGTGRLGVDYFHIKDFDQAPDETLCRRIEAVAPQRATRMGAAIRHATRLLAAQVARVRLLIILGDGFPNDVDYKGDHAVADTRRAIGEARACGIHSHAITVNLPADARLDDLFGAAHHSIIGEVRQLPDRLLGIYGRLTR